MGFKWIAEGSSGVRQQAYHPEASYTPLFDFTPIQ
jgi:hypothetical protein